MRKPTLLQRLLKNVRMSMVSVACVFIAALMMSACAGQNSNQISPVADNASQVSETTQAQVSETGQTSDGVTVASADDQEIVCRMKATTGTRFKRRICATKAQWAKLEEKKQAETDQFRREVGRRDGIAPDSGGDAMGGQTIGAPR